MAPLNRFLFPEILQPGQTADLSAEEAHHLVRVLRIEEGEHIALVDGHGSLIVAKVIEASKKRCRVQAVSLETGGQRSLVHLVFAVPKAPALEFILRRATEIGVASFQPLTTQHSLRPQSWNEDRWRKILVEVAKQCEELHFPEFLPPLSLADWLASRNPERKLVFCHESNRDAVLAAPDLNVEWDVLVGAEGGWSPEETALILSRGALPFGLGRNRLRAETAALISVALLKQKVGEL